MNLSQFFSVILTIFATSKALICYQCSYCDDIFKTPRIYERDCSGSFDGPTCEKVVYELSNSTRGVIVRRCQHTLYVANASVDGAYMSGKQGYPEDLLKEVYLQFDPRQNSTRPYVTRISVFHCQSNYCNSTSITSGSSLIILIFTLTFLFYSDSF